MKAATHSGARVGREAAFMFAGRVVGALATFAGVRLFTSVMSPEVYGRYSLLIGFIGLVTGFATGPIAQGVNRFAHEARREGAIRAFVYRALVDTTALASVGALAAFGFSAWYFRELNSWAVVGLCLGATLLAGNLRDRILALLNVFRFRGRYVVLSTLDAWLKVAAIGTGVIVWEGLAGAAVGLLLGAAIASLLCIPALRGMLRDFERDNSRRERFEPAYLYAFAKPLFAVALFGWIVATSDRYVVGRLLGDDAVGRYVAGYQIASAVPSIIMTVFFPTFTPILFERMAAQPGRPLVLDRYLVGLTALACLGVGAVVVDVDSVSKLLLSSRQFDTGDLVIPWVSMGLVFQAMHAVIEHQAYFVKQTRGLMWANAIAAAVNVGANVVLCPRVGIVGAAIATCAAYAALFGVTLALYRPAVTRGAWLRTIFLVVGGALLIVVARHAVPSDMSTYLRAPLRWGLFGLPYVAFAAVILRGVIPQLGQREGSDVGSASA